MTYTESLVLTLSDEQLAGYIARNGWVTQSPRVIASGERTADFHLYLAEHAKRVRARCGL